MYDVVTGNCCFVSFGGLGSNFIDNIGEGCGLTPKCKGYRRPNIPEGSEGLVIFGAPSETPSPKGVVNELFGGAWNSSSRAVVKNVTGTSVATLYPELEEIVLSMSHFATIHPRAPYVRTCAMLMTSTHSLGTCASGSGCPTCNMLSKLQYPAGFPGKLSC